MCNNKPESAPKIMGKPFILCWRCTGVLIGSAFTAIFLFHITDLMKPQEIALTLLLALPAIIDFGLGHYGVVRASNIRRFLTGVILGVPTTVIIVFLLNILEASIM